MSDYARAGLIQTAEIADQAVTEAKLGASAVTAAKLGAGAVTEAKLGASAVTTAKLADGAVTGPKLEALSIGTGKIQDGAVSTVKMGSNAVQGSVINSSATTLAGTIASGGSVNIALAAYTFFPMVHGVTVDQRGILMAGHPTDGASADAARFRLYNDASDSAGYDVDYRAIAP